METRTIGIIGLIVSFSVGMTANATPVNFFIEGTVGPVPIAVNPFNLMEGDTVTATAMFDDTLIDAVGQTNLQFGPTGNAFGSMLTFFLGSVEISESNVIGIPLSSPQMIFVDGDFVAFDYIALAGTNGSPVTFTSTDIFTGSGGLSGVWDVANATITPKDVPEPATFWLIGSGLIGMFGFRRHSKRIIILT